MKNEDFCYWTLLFWFGNIVWGCPRAMWMRLNAVCTHEIHGSYDLLGADGSFNANDSLRTYGSTSSDDYGVYSFRE
jgi:hypothetical protein